MSSSNSNHNNHPDNQDHDSEHDNIFPSDSCLVLPLIVTSSSSPSSHETVSTSNLTLNTTACNSNSVSNDLITTDNTINDNIHDEDVKFLSYSVLDFPFQDGSNSSGHRVHHSHASATLISTTSTVINGSTNSPNSSPSKLIRSSGRRLQSIWTAVKRFSPVNRLKTGSPLLTKKRKTFEQASRVCLSHPDLSVHDLSSVCKPRSRDDLDILAINKAAAAAAGAIGVTSGSLTQKDSTSSDQFDLRSAIRRRHSFTRDRSDEEIINSYITSTPKKLVSQFNYNSR